MHGMLLSMIIIIRVEYRKPLVATDRSDKSELISLDASFARAILLASRTHTAVYIPPHLFAGNYKKPLPFTPASTVTAQFY